MISVALSVSLFTPAALSLPQPTLTPLPLPIPSLWKSEFHFIPRLQTTRAITLANDAVPEIEIDGITLIPTIEYTYESTAIPTIPRTGVPTKKLPKNAASSQPTSVSLSKTLSTTPLLKSKISSFPTTTDVVHTKDKSLPASTIITTSMDTSYLTKNNRNDYINNSGYITDIIMNDDGEWGIQSSCLCNTAQVECGSGNASSCNISECLGNIVRTTTNNINTTTAPSESGVTSEEASICTFVVPYKYYLGVIEGYDGDSRSGNISAIASSIESKLHQELARTFLSSCTLLLLPLSSHASTGNGSSKENGSNIPPLSFRTKVIQSFAKIKYNPANCIENKHTDLSEHESDSSNNLSGDIKGNDDNHNITGSNGNISQPSTYQHANFDVDGTNCYHIQAEFVVVVMFDAPPTQQQHPRQRLLLQPPQQQQKYKADTLCESVHDISNSTSNSTKENRLLAVYDAFSDVLKRFFLSDALLLNSNLNIVVVALDHVMTMHTNECSKVPSPTSTTTSSQGDIDRIIDASSSTTLGSQNQSLQLGVGVGVLVVIIIALVLLVFAKRKAICFDSNSNDENRSSAVDGMCSRGWYNRGVWAVLFCKKLRTATTNTSDAESKERGSNNQAQDQHLQHSKQVHHSSVIIRNDNNILPNDKHDPEVLHKSQWQQNSSLHNCGKNFNDDDELLSAAKISEMMNNPKKSYLQLVTAVNFYGDVEARRPYSKPTAINMAYDCKPIQSNLPKVISSGQLNQTAAPSAEECRIISINLCDEAKEGSKTKKTSNSSRKTKKMVSMGKISTSSGDLLSNTSQSSVLTQHRNSHPTNSVYVVPVKDPSIRFSSVSTEEHRQQMQDKNQQHFYKPPNINQCYGNSCSPCNIIQGPSLAKKEAGVFLASSTKDSFDVKVTL